ncbi:hypothetical protein [Nannocystis punicea]|uniref:Uncharacterized protein n=1 Tax=Nannocystis punicea TaxID=2995304 RepID=A0ABY7H7N5_9BACT|nr:hypothetical protein [Nannocystis poenicansa]WAS95272.1 hypothetical protein O0S08_03860 [Nannocystis poenicansa]
MNPALLHLQRSENGHFVLTEPVSQTVVVAEGLAEAYARMCETLAEQPPPAQPALDGGGLFAWRGTPRALILAAALLVPTLWAVRIAFDLRAAQVECNTPATRSQGHPTRVAATRSADADREGTEDEIDPDAEADDEAAKPEPATAIVAEPAGGEAAGAEQAAPAKAEPAKAEPAKAEPAKAEPATAAP